MTLHRFATVNILSKRAKQITFQLWYSPVTRKNLKMGGILDPG